jgi:hypothetical protein
MWSPRFENFCEKLAVVAAESSQSACVVAKECGRDIPEREYFGLVIEFLCLFSHVVTRQAYGKVENAMLADMINELASVSFSVARSALPGEWNTPEECLSPKNFMDKFRSRQVRLGECRKLFAFSNESLANTVLWEFSKDLCNVLRIPAEIGSITAITMICTDDLKYLDIPRFVSDEMVGYG